MAKFLKHGERRVDDAWTWAIGATDMILDRLDDLVTMARFLGDEVQNDQPEIAVGEEAAETGATTAVMSAVSTVPDLLATIFIAGEAATMAIVGVLVGHSISECISIHLNVDISKLTRNARGLFSKLPHDSARHHPKDFP
jgi:hypothetical protein